MIDQEKWNKYSFFMQMGNIASEIARAINYQDRNDIDNLNMSLLRTIELIDLTIDARSTKRRYKELCLFRELLCDWYSNTNLYTFNPESLKKYALDFGLLAKK